MSTSNLYRPVLGNSDGLELYFPLQAPLTQLIAWHSSISYQKSRAAEIQETTFNLWY